MRPARRGDLIRRYTKGAFSDARQAHGLAAVLATGRILDELEHDFPRLVEHFDAVVAENGAVLVVAGDIQDLAPPVDDALARALDERHVRHHPQDAAAPLPHHRWFDFRGPDGAVTATAPDVVTFNRLLQSLDAGIIAYHLERGDFSRWITGVLRDRHLAATAGAIERDVPTRRAAGILHARDRLGDAIDARYRDAAD